MIKKLICVIFLGSLFVANSCYAVMTMNSYFKLKSSIPDLERSSATNIQDKQALFLGKAVLNTALESTATTIVYMVAAASSQGHTMFCGLPGNEVLTGFELEKIVQQVYRSLPPEKQKEINNEPFTELAVLGMMKKYPCK